MAISDTQAAPPEQSERCHDCRHCVEVRGMDEVVCLAYLTIRNPLTEAACGEFERKKASKPPVPASQ